MLFIKHYLFSIIIEDCGKTEGTGTPWRSRRQRQDPPFTFLLCPAAMLPNSWTEGPVCTYRRMWERTAHRASTARHQVSKGTSWKGWWGQSAKKPVCWPLAVSWTWGGGVEKGWSRRVSCVDSSVAVWSGQTRRADDAGGLVMWGWNTSGSIA